MKMTGAGHGAGTDQIIYSTIAESIPSWTYKYEGGIYRL